MKVEGSHSVPGDMAAVYALLIDPQVLADCIPGCKELVDSGQGVYDMKLKVVLAAVSGDFTGKVSMRDSTPPTGHTLGIEGTGKIGFIKGEGRLTLSAAEDGKGTQVAYAGDVQIGGTMAAVGQRLLDSTARMMIRKFFDKLSARMSEDAS